MPDSHECPGKHSRAGQPVELGVCLGHPWEVYLRWGRLVGILHHVEGQKYIVRKFSNHTEEWPTGPYVKTSIFGLHPHRI